MQPTLPPGTESWPERYGAIGVVALLALIALGLGLRQLLRERGQDRDEDRAAKAAAEARANELSAKLVESVTANHRETLALLGELQDKHEARYGALLERHIAETGKSAEALRAQSMATAEALSGLVKKISRS